MSRADITHQSEVQDLAALTDRIRAEHKATQTAMRNAVAHALNAGDALTQAKAAVSGDWLRWLRSNCSLSVRTAQLYMRLAQHRAEVEHRISGAPDFSVRAAQRLISRPKVATTGKRTTTGTPASVSSATDTAAAKFAVTLTKALRTALSLQRSEKPPTPALVGILSKLSAKHLDLHDIAIIVRPRPSARTHARRRG